VWPMFVWKSHESDSPKHIGAFDEATGRSGASLVAFGHSSGAQHLSIPVLLPPSCCGVGQLQARCTHPQKALLSHPEQLELTDDSGDIIATSNEIPFAVANAQRPRRVCAQGEAMRIIAPAPASVVRHNVLADMRRLPVFFTCDAVPGAVHRLLLNADVYLQWDEHHLQSLDADLGKFTRGRRFRSILTSAFPHTRACAQRLNV
jgi:hypothetical protein